MEKIRCEICGKPGSRINFVCGECTTRSITKVNVKIGKKTIETMQELEAALEVMANAGADPKETEPLKKVKSKKRGAE